MQLLLVVITDVLLVVLAGSTSAGAVTLTVVASIGLLAVVLLGAPCFGLALLEALSLIPRFRLAPV